MIVVDTTLQKILWLALAGALGTLARYGLSGLVQHYAGASYPWGTLAVNALGCLLFGFVWALAESRMLISPAARFVVLTGFMGAFTTFSTYAFESSALMRESQWLLAAGNVLLQNAVGMAMAVVGFILGKLF